MEFDEDSFQEEIEKMHDRLYMHFFDDRRDLKELYKVMSSIHNDMVGHEIGFLSEFNFDDLKQDDDKFKSFLFRKETRLSKRLGTDYHTKLQSCIFPNDVVKPYNYKRAFAVALQRFLKDLKKDD